MEFSDAFVNIPFYLHTYFSNKSEITNIVHILCGFLKLFYG